MILENSLWHRIIFIFGVILIITNLSPANIFSQSPELVRNGSFEEHGIVKSVEFKLPNWNNYLFFNYIGLNSGALLCDCNYKFTEVQKYIGLPTRSCLKKAFNDTSKCSYVQLYFVSHITDINRTHTAGSGSSYISHEFVKPIDYGEIYEISFWIYVPKKFNETSENLINHMGFSLSNKKLPSVREKEILSVPAICIDTFVHDEWVKVTKFVRPLCDINYMTLGVFSNKDWPNYYHDQSVIYFIDNVSIKQVFDTESISNIQNFPCFKLEDYSLEELQTIVYFDSGKDIIKEIDTLKIKKIVNKTKKEKSTISITGHTDNTGTENMVLSEIRAKNVQRFINNNFKINPIHFDLLGVADSFPEVSNSSAKNMAKNRRVVIKATTFSIAQKVYVDVLEKANKNDLSVFKDIYKWLHLEVFKKHLLVLLDSRLKALHSKPQWENVYKKVKEEYKKYKNPELAFILDSLTGEDQRYRTLNSSFKSMTPLNKPLIRKKIDEYSESLPDSIELFHDKDNLNKILPLLDKYGWPKISKVGVRATRSAFYIIDHTSNLELIKVHLLKLKKACREGEAEWRNYANMYDRMLNIQDLPQKYGTHYITEGKKIKYYKYTDFEEINRNREKIGLHRLSEKINFTLK